MDFVDPQQAFQFVPVWKWLLWRPELSDGARLTYAILCRYATRTDIHGVKFADCAQRTVANELSRSVRSIKEYIAELSEHQLILIMQCRVPGQGGSANHYYFPRHPWMSFFRRADHLFSRSAVYEGRTNGVSSGGVGAESCTYQVQNPAPRKSAQKRDSAAEIPTNPALFDPGRVGAESCTPLGEKRNSTTTAPGVRAEVPEDVVVDELNSSKANAIRRELELCGVGRKARNRILPDLLAAGVTPLQIRLGWIEAKKVGRNPVGLLLTMMAEGGLPKLKLTPELVVKLVNSGEVVQVEKWRVAPGYCRWNASSLHIYGIDLRNASSAAFACAASVVMNASVITESILILSGHEPGKE